MIPQIQDLVVNVKKWMSEDEMLDCIAVSQSLPGVVAVNTATYVGYKKSGILGAVSATLGVIFPAFLSIIIAVRILDTIGDNKYVAGAFTGIKAGICGLILVTAVKMFKQTAKSKESLIFSVAVCLASLVAVAFFGVTAVFVIMGAIVAGIVFSCAKGVNK